MKAEREGNGGARSGKCFAKTMTITRTKITTRMMKHDKKDDDDCDGDDD